LKERIDQNAKKKSMRDSRERQREGERERDNDAIRKKRTRETLYRTNHCHCLCICTLTISREKKIKNSIFDYCYHKSYKILLQKNILRFISQSFMDFIDVTWLIKTILLKTSKKNQSNNWIIYFYILFIMIFSLSLNKRNHWDMQHSQWLSSYLFACPFYSLSFACNPSTVYVARCATNLFEIYKSRFSFSDFPIFSFFTEQ
jgi:hypothetical protein